MSNFKLEIRWGVIFTLSLLAWMIIERLVGLHTTYIDKHPLYTSLFAIVAVVLYALALREKRRTDFGGRMNWAQGFITGVYISIVVAVLSPLNQLLIHKVVSPQFFTNAATHAVETGNMSAQEAGEYFSLSNYMVQSTIGALLMGIVTAAVVALFVRGK